MSNSRKEARPKKEEAPPRELKTISVASKVNKIFWDQLSKAIHLPGVKYVGVSTSITWDALKEYHLARLEGLNEEAAANKSTLKVVAGLGVGTAVGYAAKSIGGARGVLYLAGVLAASSLAEVSESSLKESFISQYTHPKKPATFSQEMLGNISANLRGEAYGMASVLAGPSKLLGLLTNIGYDTLRAGQEKLYSLSKHFGGWMNEVAQDVSYQQKMYASLDAAWVDVSGSLFKSSMPLREQKPFSADDSLLYYNMARAEFDKYFTLNTQQKLVCSLENKAKFASVARQAAEVTPNDIAADLATVRADLAKQIHMAEEQGTGIFHDYMTRLNGHIEKSLQAYVAEINKKIANNSLTAEQRSQLEQERLLAKSQSFCDTVNMFTQGAALIANISGHRAAAAKIIGGGMAATQIIAGISSLAISGFSTAGVGMVLGGINGLFSVFGKGGGDRLGKATIQMLCMISEQISALHEDMLKHFGQVYKALGIIHQDIIREFCELHRHVDQIEERVIRIQSMLEAEGHSVNAVGVKIDELMRQSSGYWKKSRTLKWKKECTTVKQEKEWGLSFENYKALHNKLMVAVTTLQDNTQSEAEEAKITDALMARELNGELGSAEADINLLVKYAQTRLGLPRLPYQIDPLAWETCTQLLIELFQQFSKTAQYRGMPQKVYDDFDKLLKMGESWLVFISSLRTERLITALFDNYEASLKACIAQTEIQVQALEKQSWDASYKRFSHYDSDQTEKFKRQELVVKTDVPGWHTGYINKPTIKYAMAGSWNCQVPSSIYTSDQIKQFEASRDSYVALLAQRLPSEVKPLSFFESNETTLTVSPWLKQREKFIYPETNSGYKQLLPLTLTPMFDIPPEFLLAEALELGRVQYRYQVAGGKFIVTLSFVANDNKVYAYASKEKPFTPRAHFNPDEDIWHCWVSGNFPASAATKTITHPRHYYPKGDYHDTYSYVPNCSQQVGLQDSFAQVTAVNTTSAVASLDKVKELVQAKLVLLRLDANHKTLQRAEDANTTSNKLSAALIALDAHAKILKAFLSILFRKSCIDDPILAFSLNTIFDKLTIIEYLKTYQGQSIYLHHYLKSTLEILVHVKAYVIDEKLKKVNKDFEYPLVENMLNALRDFIAQSKAKVVSNEQADPALAINSQLTVMSADVLNNFMLQLLQNATIKGDKLEIDLNLFKPQPKPAVDRFTVVPPSEPESSIPAESLKYDDQDITIYLDTMIKHTLGGYAKSLDLVLQRQFFDATGESYKIAILPSVGGLNGDVDYFRRVDMFLDKAQQPVPDETRPDHRHDVFDELIPAFKRSAVNHAKIFFSYNVEDNHWLTGEIVIEKQDYHYSIKVYLHDSFGQCQMSDSDYHLVKASCEKRISSAYSERQQKNLRFTFTNEQSPYLTKRQMDTVSCGLIHVEEMLKRIRNESLDRSQPYPENALELREKHIEDIKRYLPETDRNRQLFLSKHENIAIRLRKQEASQNRDLVAETSQLRFF